MELNFNEILLLEKDRKYQESLVHLNRLIDKEKNNPNYYHLKGTLHYNLDEFSDAIKSFSIALSIKKDDHIIYYLRGLSYFNLNDFDYAKKDFEIALSLKKNYPEVYYALGVLHFESFNNTESIKYLLESIKLKNNFKQPIIQLIKTLSHTSNVTINNSDIIAKHKEINKIFIDYSSDKYISDDIVKNFLTESSKIIKNNFEDLGFKGTQIYRKNQNFLNCKRHKKIFNTYNVIPEFCFECYKVLIEPENILDLIKLYIIFDNIKLEKNNLRKCMIEVRPNVSGKYKGLIYCNSINEAKIIEKKINILLKKNLNKKLLCKIKRGCTEYGMKYIKYNNLEGDILEYKEEWKNSENMIEKKYPHLISSRKNIPTIKGASLNDILIVKNWLRYSKTIGDNTGNLLSELMIDSKF